MSPKNTGTPSKFTLQVTHLHDGVVDDLPPGVTLMLEGTASTQAQIVTTLADYEKTWSAVDTARAQLTAAVAARAKVEAQANAYVKALTAVLKQYFGSANPVLANFGIALPKPKKVLTSEEKAVKAAKARGTRAVHGPQGKVQKANVTTSGKPGVTVTDPNGAPMAGGVTAPVAPATPAAPASPAPTAPSNGSGSGK